MELNFDKEMDALLRQLREGEAVPADGRSKSHADADEICAFAENALPAPAKIRLAGHLADCPSCRLTLANFIRLTREPETEKAAAAAPAAPAAVPWYRQLFVQPRFGYALGALALVFSGVIGLLVYQGANRVESFDLAKANSNSATTGGSETFGAEPPVDRNEPAQTSNVGVMNENRTSAAPGSRSNNPVNMSAADARSAKKNQAPTGAGAAESSALLPAADENSVPAPAAPPPPPAAVAETRRADRADEARKEKREQPAEAEDQALGDLAAAKAAPSPVGEAGRADRTARRPAEKTMAAPPVKIVSGKTFRRRDGAWYDASYDGQPTVNVRRGSAQFQKLDRQLRVIAGALNGTVVVIWNDKAYRFQ